MLGKSKAQRIYKAVRNYLHNELLVNKAYIDKIVIEYVDKRIEHEVHQKMDNLEEIICNRVAAIMSNKTFDARRVTLSSLIYEEIKKSVHKMIDGKLAVEVTLEK